MDQPISDPPIDAGLFACVPGRYFLMMFLLPLPKKVFPAHGGDITGLLWRLEREPNTWQVTLRLRSYIDDSGDPEAPDEKRWSHRTLPGAFDELQAEGLVIELLVELAAGLTRVTGLKALAIDAFPIKGDHRAFFDLVKKGALPPWLHIVGQAPDSRIITRQE